MDSFTITIIIISVSGFIGAFIKGKRKDRCLIALNNKQVTILRLEKEKLCGILNIEANCMAISLVEKKTQKNEILYKNEYDSIKKIVYTLGENLEENKQRQREYNNTISPSFIRKFSRKIRIIFNITKDAVFELSEAFLAKTKMTAMNQTKFVDSIKNHTTVTASNYQPLWEKYLGKDIMLEQTINNIKTEYYGILKEYSANYIYLYDVNYNNGEKIQKSDIIFPRSNSVVRRLLSKLK